MVMQVHCSRLDTFLYGFIYCTSFKLKGLLKIKITVMYIFPVLFTVSYNY